MDAFLDCIDDNIFSKAENIVMEWQENTERTTPVLRTLHSIINDSHKAENNKIDVEPCQPYVFTTHDHIIYDDMIGEEPPPSQSPPPPQNNNTESLDYESSLINKWDNLIGKQHEIIKTRSSMPQLTDVQIREDVTEI